MNRGLPAWKPSALTIALQCPYINEMKNSWYLNLSGFYLTLHAAPYTIPYSERAFIGLLESIVLVNGTQKFASLDFREVCGPNFIKACLLPIGRIIELSSSRLFSTVHLPISIPEVWWKASLKSMT